MKWSQLKEKLTNPIGVWRDNEEKNNMLSFKIDKMEDSKRRRFFYKADKRSENQVYISSKEYQEIYYQTRQNKKKLNEIYDPDDIKSAILTQKRKDKLKKKGHKKNKSTEMGKKKY